MRGTSRTAGAMEICKGALAATTGQARSANIGVVGAEAPVAVPPVVGGHAVPSGGVTHAVTVAGHLVCTTGQNVSRAGHEVCLGGQRVSTAGQRVSPVGHWVSTGGQRVATAPVAEHAVSCGGH